MRAGERDGKTLNHRLSEFLFSYRSSNHATMNVSPSELFLHRTLRTRFDLLKPDTRGFVVSKQAEQKMHHDKHSRARNLFSGQAVMVRDFRQPNKYIPILKKLGPVTYSVEVENGKILKRHIDHLTQRMVPSRQPAMTAPTLDDTDTTIQDNFQYSNNHELPTHISDQGQEQAEVRRYPQRDRRPPERLMFVCKC